MKLAAEIVVVIVVFAIPLAVVFVVFVWGAIKDGEEDRAVQRRLGIRRRTRLGR
jgi:choline-glycine betaine transporter